MKRILFLVPCSLFLLTGAADAYQLISSRELGHGEAKTQNIVVQCTTVKGRLSNEQCQLRRQASCRMVRGEQDCSGWQPWRILRNPTEGFGDWRQAADACCRAKGLR